MNASKRNRRALVEQNAHGPLSGVGQAALCVFQHGLHLLAAHARKPIEEVANGRAALEVLEESPNGNPCACEHPVAADAAGHTLHGRTLRPIKHADSIAP